jgi:hypothetical protein
LKKPLVLWCGVVIINTSQHKREISNDTLYTTKFTNGHIIETSNVYDARQIQNYGDGQTFFLSGKPVSYLEFFETVCDVIDAKQDKKELTHKKIRVLYGSSVACYVNIWVRR